MPAEGPDRALDPTSVRRLNARVAREVDAGSCEQSDARQSVAGIVVGEKNRCLRITAPGRVERRRSAPLFRAGRDNFRDSVSPRTARSDRALCEGHQRERTAKPMMTNAPAIASAAPRLEHRFVSGFAPPQSTARQATRQCRYGRMRRKSCRERRIDPRQRPGETDQTGDAERCHSMPDPEPERKTAGDLEECRERKHRELNAPISSNAATNSRAPRWPQRSTDIAPSSGCNPRAGEPASSVVVIAALSTACANGPRASVPRPLHRSTRGRQNIRRRSCEAS